MSLSQSIHKQDTKMKFLIVLSVAVACVVADVSHVLNDESSAPILKSSYDISPEGAYNWAYETANGIAAQEEGHLKNVNAEYPSIETQGAYKYIAPGGEPVSVTYIANENGFQPEGSHLPVPPPIPELIARSLQYIAAHPPQPEGSIAKSPVYRPLG